MTYTGMDVGQIRAVAAGFQQRHDLLAGIRATVGGLAGIVEGLWLGPHATQFHADWNGVLAPQLEAAARALGEAAATLRRNADQQEAASGGAGPGSAPAPAPNCTVGSVENAMKRIDRMTDEQDGIVVQRVDDGRGHVRYLVLVSGVNPHHRLGLTGPEGHNIPSAAGGSFGVSGEIEREVQEALRRSGVPHGADVALVGHSQGGIVAMNLAADPGFRERYHVTDVVTAGSPVGERPVPSGDTANYVHLTARYDGVPDLEVSPRFATIVSAPFASPATPDPAGLRLDVDAAGPNDGGLSALNPFRPGGWALNPYSPNASHDPGNYAAIAADDHGRAYDAFRDDFVRRYSGSTTEIYLDSELRDERP